MKWVNVAETAPTSFEMMLLRQFGVKVDLSQEGPIVLAVALIALMVLYRVTQSLSRGR